MRPQQIMRAVRPAYYCATRNPNNLRFFTATVPAARRYNRKPKRSGSWVMPVAIVESAFMLSVGLPPIPIAAMTMASDEAKKNRKYKYSYDSDSDSDDYYDVGSTPPKRHR